MGTFNYDIGDKIEWDFNDNEIKCIEKQTFEECKVFYKKLLQPSDSYDSTAAKLTPETFTSFKSEVKRNSTMRQLAKRHSIENLLPKISSGELMKDMNDFSELAKLMKNRNQKDKRNFVSCRVFSEKFKDEIRHTSLEKHALLGDRSLTPRLYTVYLASLRDIEDKNKLLETDPEILNQGIDATPDGASGSRLRQEKVDNERETRFETNPELEAQNKGTVTQPVTESEEKGQESLVLDKPKESLTKDILTLPKQENQPLIDTSNAKSDAMPSSVQHPSGNIGITERKDSKTSAQMEKTVPQKEGCCTGGKDCHIF